jgi:hypothetical protein
MIDFPNAPVDGQIFVAPTGVSYRWVAATGLWVTAAGTTPGGDFYVSHPGIALTSTPATMVFNTVQSGNSGNWYSTTTGRFTPPAGRYFLSAGLSVSASAATNMAVYLRKNGVQIPPGQTLTSAAANWYGGPTVNATVDANGTDWFDVQGFVSVGGTTYATWFLAFPLSGVQGPPGPPGGGFRVLSRQVLAAAAGDINFQNIPTDINSIEVEFDMNPATGDSDLVLQFYGANGVLDSTAAHYTGVVWAMAHVASANANLTAMSSVGSGITNSIALTYSTSGYRVGAIAGAGIKGTFRVPNIKAATTKAAVGQASYSRATDSAVVAATFNGTRNQTEAITGLRLLFGTGNVSAGGTMEVWGSP